jgi:hypothetical protein
MAGYHDDEGERVMAETENKYTAEEALQLAELWSAGKTVGGDEEGVIFALLDEIKRLRSAWQPIETAPMNIEVLISDGEYVYAATCRYQGGEPDEDWAVPMASSGYRPVIRKPTYWMPLPEPPQV